MFLLLFLSFSFVYCSLLLRCLHLFPSPTLSHTISLYFIHWLYLQGNKANDTLEVCARCILFRPTYALKHLEDPEGTSNRTLWRRIYEGEGGGGGGGYKLLADVYPPPPFPSRIIYIDSYIHTYIHTYIHIYIHTYIHTYVRTYIHTYIHIHTLIDRLIDIVIP